MLLRSELHEAQAIFKMITKYCLSCIISIWEVAMGTAALEAFIGQPTSL